MAEWYSAYTESPAKGWGHDSVPMIHESASTTQYDPHSHDRPSIQEPLDSTLRATKEREGGKKKRREEGRKEGRNKQTSRYNWQPLS